MPVQVLGSTRRGRSTKATLSLLRVEEPANTRRAHFGAIPHSPGAGSGAGAA